MMKGCHWHTNHHLQDKIKKIFIIKNKNLKQYKDYLIQA